MRSLTSLVRRESCATTYQLTDRLHDGANGARVR